MDIQLTHYVLVASALFALGLFGLFTRRNAIALLMAVELMMLAAVLNFAAGAYYLGQASGLLFVIFIVTIAAAEAAVGLALIIAVYRQQQNLTITATDKLSVLKG